MADVKRCDRCGKIYEIVETNALEILAGEFAEALALKNKMVDRTLERLRASVDLCTRCEADFKKWWNRRVDNDT